MNKYYKIILKEIFLSFILSLFVMSNMIFSSPISIFSNNKLKEDEKILFANEWVKKQDEFYYYNEKGQVEKSKWIDGKYYVDEDGKMLKNCTKTISGKTYLFGDDGIVNEKKELDNNSNIQVSFSKEIARRAIIYAISNANDLDTFLDGDTYDVTKFHAFGVKKDYSMSFYEDGKWAVVDSNTWHVDDLKLKPDNINIIPRYVCVSSDIRKRGSIYKLINLKYMWLSSPENTSATEKYYGWDEGMFDEETYPMINVDESMLNLSDKSEMIAEKKTESFKIQENSNNETNKYKSETKKQKKGLFDDPDVRFKKFVDAMCEELYGTYGYKLGTQIVDEIEEGVIDGMMQIKIKNRYGTWENHTIHCKMDFNKEKLLKWEVK